MSTATVTKAKKSPAKKAPRPKGRRPIISQEIADTIAGYIKIGVFVDEACGAAGISRASYYNWMERGRAERERMRMLGELSPRIEEKDYVDFLDIVEKAYDEATLRNMAVVAKASERGDWRAATWWLEQARPHKYGKRERIEHTGADGGAVKVEVHMGDLEEKIAKVLAIRNK